MAAIAALCYVVFFLTVAFLVIGLPVYLTLEACRAGRRALGTRRAERPVTTRERARAEAVLREQYASGMLTLVGLEERVEDVLRARRGVELQSVLDDLPPRPPAHDRVAIGLVALGLALALGGSLPAHVAGICTATAGFLPRRHWVVAVLAFAAGALLVGGGIVAGLGVAAAASALAFVIYKPG
jgi:hypothetical protein